MKTAFTLEKLYGPVRYLVILSALIHALFYFTVWIFAFKGNTELVFDFVDIDSTALLTPLQIIGGVICSGVVIAAMCVVAIGANRLLKRTYKNGFIQDGVSSDLKLIGYGMIMFWLGLILAEDVMPWILTWYFETGAREELEWFPLDPNIIALTVGFLLILVASAIEDARIIEAENKQFI